MASNAPSNSNNSEEPPVPPVPPVAAAASAAAEPPVVSAGRWHPAHRPTWFRELMEELEPLHDCTEARLAEHVCVINRILSIVNWDVLQDIQSIHIASSSIINDITIPDNEHKLTDLDLLLRKRAEALGMANIDETVGTEVAIQILVGEYISKCRPEQFPFNIHRIISNVGKKEQRNKYHRTVAFNKDSVDSLFSEWNPYDFFYSEATGIGSITKFVKKKGIVPIEIATRYVDPASSKKTTKNLSFTGFSDDLVGLLGNIKCTVNPDITNNSNENNDTDTNITSVIAEKFKDYPLLSFPTAAAAGLVANILSEYHNKRKEEVYKTKSSKPQQVIEAVQYLNESQDSIESEIEAVKSNSPSNLSSISSSNSSSNNSANLPKGTLKRLLHDFILKGANHLIQIADEAERGEYRVSSSESNSSINSKEARKELESLANAMKINELGKQSPEIIAAYEASLKGPSPGISDARARRPRGFSGYESNRENLSMFEMHNNNMLKPAEHLLPQIKKVYEKSNKNLKNFVKLVILAVNIYEQLYKSTPETALQITMRTILHLKSYGDSFQLKEIDAIMKKPENSGRVLWLVSIDRIFLALAGLYAIDGGWNLITIQQSSSRQVKEFLIMRDYRQKVIPSKKLSKLSKLPKSPKSPTPPKKLIIRRQQRIQSFFQNTKKLAREAREAREARARRRGQSGVALASPVASAATAATAPFATAAAPAPLPSALSLGLPFAHSSTSGFEPLPAVELRRDPISLAINLPPLNPQGAPSSLLSGSPQGALSSLSRGYQPSPNNNSNQLGGSRRYKQRKTLKNRKGRRHTRRRT